MTTQIEVALEQMNQKLGRIERLLVYVLRQQEREMTGLANVTAAVAAEQTVDASAIALLNGLKTELDAAIAANQGGDDSQLQALSDQLSTEQAALAAAVTANTPAAPAAPSA